MRKIILFILLFSVTISLHSQWKTSSFFQNEKKSEYAVSLQTVEKYPLSKEDTKTIIDILSAYHWDEFRIIKQQGIETWPEARREIEGGYFSFDMIYYSIIITHPDKRKVTLQINNRGIRDEWFLVEYPRSKSNKEILCCTSSFYGDDIKKIKQLFLKNDVIFNNISENEIVKIKPVFSFYDVFSKLELPPAPVDTALSKQFIRLYNSGWNNGNGTISSSKGTRQSLWRLYTHHNVMQTGTGAAIPYFSNYNLDFKNEDTYQMLAEMVNTMLKGHDGEGEQTLQHNTKICYQYKDGLLHGQLKKYTLDGKLTDEATFDKGFPTSYIKYADSGMKEKEIYFMEDVNFTGTALTWTEYDEKGNVKDSGKSHIYYDIAYSNHDEFQNFYKTNK